MVPYMYYHIVFDSFNLSSKNYLKHMYKNGKVEFVTGLKELFCTYRVEL